MSENARVLTCLWSCVCFEDILDHRYIRPRGLVYREVLYWITKLQSYLDIWEPHSLSAYNVNVRCDLKKWKGIWKPENTWFVLTRVKVCVANLEIKKAKSNMAIYDQYPCNSSVTFPTAATRGNNEPQCLPSVRWYIISIAWPHMLRENRNLKIRIPHWMYLLETTIFSFPFVIFTCCSVSSIVLCKIPGMQYWCLKLPSSL